MKAKTKNSLSKLFACATVSALILAQSAPIFAVGNHSPELVEPISTISSLESARKTSPDETFLSEDDKKWVIDNMINTKDVRLNDLGLDRVNKARTSKGLGELTACVEFGQEVIDSSSSIDEDNQIMALSGTAASEVLPSSVDNSLLNAFPSIKYQGKQGSCVAFSTTYYQMTHMTALMKGWNTKNDGFTDKFSPKWTYNLTKYAGSGAATTFPAAFELLKNSGCVFWSDLPYNGNDETDYKSWPTDRNLWEKALNYKIDKMGYIDFSDGTETPIENEHDESLNTIKKMLANGYVLTFGTHVESWTYCLAGDERVCYMLSGSEGPHAMTIVGYSDDLTFDANLNGTIDPGEKGAFKIANSYEDEWISGGYVWLAYDALNKVPKIPSNPNVYRGIITDPPGRVGAIDSNTCFWFNVKDSYTPKLTAELEVSHKSRNQLQISFGYSTTEDTTITMPYWYKIIPNDTLAFDGSNSEDKYASLVIDLTDLYSLKIDNPNGNWYLRIEDIVADGIPGKIKSFKLVDHVTRTELHSAITSEISFDGNKIEVPIYYTREKTPSASWSILKGQQGGRLDAAYVSLNGILYVIGGMERRGQSVTYVSSVDACDTRTTPWTWTQKADTRNLRGDPEAIFYPKAYAINNKIYAVGQGSGWTIVVDEYNPSANSWARKIQVPLNGGALNSAVANNKIYIFQRLAETSILYEYDPSTGILRDESQIASLPETYIECTLSSANGKVYLFGSDTLASKTSVWEYNPNTNIWTRKSDIPYSNIYTAVTLNNKIYTLEYYSGSEMYYTNRFKASYIKEYNPLDDTWTENLDTLPISGTSDLAVLDNKILLIGNYEPTNPSSTKLYALYLPGKWTEKSSMPLPKAYHTSAVLNNKIYAIGGVDNSLSPTNTVQCYEPSNNSWTPIANMIAPRYHAASATLSGAIYVAGGNNASYLKSMEIYNPSTGNWLPGTDMNIARSSFGLVSVNGKLYAISGKTNGGVRTNTVEEYNPSTKQWKLVANIPTPRDNFATAVVNGEIYVIGGFYTNGTNTNAKCSIVEKYNPSTNRWTRVADMSTTRSGLSAVEVNGKIYALGGAENLGGNTYVTEEYDVASNKWKTVAYSGIAREGFTASVVNNKIYTMGGWDSTVRIIDIVEEFIP
ncbi:Kelch repeat-containing protein [Acetivibrio mesophilus]|uniref:Uncharacterized protein n=1 Tax=Acetivibrio mesophilus TaxID=2487273 RepID=A0A4Q0I0V0_9FIRM|nr:kelch repeat-containing protein [Acetivibrio mesophilus]ODM27923.1 hypothetical protein A7W90_17880 [Clostridium sp. Bc-iso-3]RXE57846.1 hypothetical protein EFD62_15355 [Acetivibrio mesophilus]